MVNKDLVKRLGISDENVKKIEELHVYRDSLFRLMENSKDHDALKALDKECELVEFRLQELWGFTKDKNYHKFWYRPGCTCPRMDNNDNYPYGRYTVSYNCPLHGVANSFNGDTK